MKSEAEIKTGRGKRTTGIMVMGMGAAIVAGLFRFNSVAGGYNEYLVGNLIGLFWLPMLSILLLFREEPSGFGFTLGSSRKVWGLTAILFAGLLVILYFASSMSGFQDKYPWFRQFPEFQRAFFDYPAQNPYTSHPWTMLYGIASYGMYLFCWEFFFRGYLLLGMYRAIGWSAVLVQAAAFALLHAGKPSLEVLAALPAGVILGIVALNAKSFVPCFVLHWAASVVFDLLVFVAARR